MKGKFVKSIVVFITFIRHHLDIVVKNKSKKREKKASSSSHISNYPIINKPVLRNSKKYITSNLMARTCRELREIWEGL